MWTRELFRIAGFTSILLAALGCDEQKKTSAQAPASAAPPAASVAPPAHVAPAAPGDCKASGEQPMKLGTPFGMVYGFAGDSTSLYYTTWQVYGSRGDLGRIRKDGEGTSTLASLKLEPRGLAVDDENIYYTEGIRLMKTAKENGKPAMLADKFSSQAIALDITYVYGVPGNYGPYDRVAKLAKTGGDIVELAKATRPRQGQDLVGYGAIAVDLSGIYVADLGNNQVLRFPLAGGKPKTLASRQPRPYDLAIDSTQVYFSLAEKRQLMMLPKSGGTAVKLASGLVDKARVAADDDGAIATLAPQNDQSPLLLFRVSKDGQVTTLASVPPSHEVVAVALDRKCVYWAQRETGSGNLAVYARAK
jgi:hypothetical protein